jgi:hypothetical protein
LFCAPARSAEPTVNSAMAEAMAVSLTNEFMSFILFA